jgi:protein phosphatase
MGASLPKPVCATVLERHGSKNFRVGLAEMNGWRGSMEDAHVVHFGDGWGYFGILDGHGGEECSAWCAQRLHEKLSTEGCPANDAEAKKMVLDVDQEFLDTGKPSGSTAAMCAVRVPDAAGKKYQLHVINAGDSRVMLSSADGKIIDGGGTDSGLTVDHKPDNPVEHERIYRCGGTVEEAMGGVHRVNGDLAVSRGFGDAEYKKTGGPGLEDRPVTANPEMGHFEASASDFLLVVCDGVSEGNFSNAEVCELAARVLKETGGDAAAAAEAVCYRAVETDSKDNISCMIVLLGGAEVGGSPIGQGKQVKFNPGCMLGCDNAGFLKAYLAMCARGGTSLAEAAETRYTLLIERKGSAGEDADDAAELALFSSPEGAAGSAERKAWFEKWAQEKEDGGGAGSDDGMGGGGIDGGLGGALSGRDPAEQLAMMRMVLGMVRQAPGGMQ